MYFLDVATAVASVHTLWTDLHLHLPADVHIQVENAGDIIEDSTGTLTGAWSAASVAVVNGSSSDPYSGPSGAVVDWMTDTIAAGRRLRGRTFLVPWSGTDYQNDGTLAGSAITAIQDAADALIASQSTSFVVYHRGTGSDGSNGLVTSARVPDLAAVLRSRRD
jgi:hypothetical protein